MSEIRADTVRTKSSDTNLTMYGEGTGNLVLGSGAGITTISRTGLVDVKNSGTASAVQLYCESSNAHYVKVQSPAHSTFTGGSWTMTLPGINGDAGQFLQTNGSGVTSWASVATYGMVNVGTATADNSGTTLTITGLDTTYRTYCISLTDFKVVGGGNQLWFRIGDSGGIKTDSNYHCHLSKTNSSTTSYDGATVNAGNHFLLADYGGSDADETGGAVLFLHQTGKTCTINGTMAWGHNSGYIQGGWFAGGYKSTSFAVTQVQMTTNSGNLPTGTMDVWGIKNAS